MVGRITIIPQRIGVVSINFKLTETIFIGGEFMKRDSSLDCLRVLACFLVILLHVSAEYVIDNIENYNFQFTVGNFFDSMSRICVPLFVMLSGAFLLENPKNKDFVNFYKKSIFKIGIPTFVWSLIYVIYSYII